MVGDEHMALNSSFDQTSGEHMTCDGLDEQTSGYFPPSVGEGERINSNSSYNQMRGNSPTTVSGATI